MSQLIEETTGRTTTELEVSQFGPQSEPSGVRACLVLHSEGHAEVVYLRPPNDTVVVGRSFPADVCIPSPDLSRQHARFSLRLTQTGVTIRMEDLGSRNGSWLRGERIEHADLQPGDELLLGSVKATLSLVTPPARAARPAATPDGGDIIVAAPSMEALYELVGRVAKSDVTVLICGETGTGKEHVATSLHGLGPRAGRPFRAINCGAIPENLTGSILFGHERGAFTGAHQRSLGVFEQAQGGTVFLDEIGELPLAVQATLLRVLETKRVTRLGGSQEIPLDVRVLAATHCDVQRMVQEGSFRQDLLYRLNAITLEVPALRQRREEIEPLCEFFMRKAERDWARPPGRIDPDAVAALMRHDWPGNIRQLRNVIERAVLLCQDNCIRVEDLPSDLRLDTGETSPGLGHVDLPTGEADPAAASFREQVRALEVELIKRAMVETGGNQRAAAKLLRMPRRTLVYKLRAYGLGSTPAGEAGDQGEPEPPG